MSLFDELDTIHRMRKDYEEFLNYIGNLYDVTRELKNSNVNLLDSYYKILNRIVNASNELMQKGCDIMTQLADALRNGWNYFKEKNKETLKNYNTIPAVSRQKDTAGIVKNIVNFSFNRSLHFTKCHQRPSGGFIEFSFFASS